MKQNQFVRKETKIKLGSILVLQKEVGNDLIQLIQ